MKARHESNSGFVLQVADTGIGMAPEDIPKALARFQQVEIRSLDFDMLPSASVGAECQASEAPGGASISSGDTAGAKQLLQNP